jgi:GDP-L-fucose synthase
VSREFLYAGDCARAIAVALQRRTGPEPINLGTGREITIRDLADLVKKVGNYDAEIMWDVTKPDGQPRRCLDVTRAKIVLRWEAQTSLEEMIRKTIEWYRNERKSSKEAS